jgi:hypothetical protein
MRCGYVISRRASLVKALVEFVDRYTIDPHIYMVAPRMRQPGRYEIFWDREHLPCRWRLRLVGDVTWERFPSEQLIEVLTTRAIDVERVEYQLRSIALAQVVFAEALTQEAKSLFGRETVVRAIADHHAFLEELKQLVNRYARGTLRPIDGGGESSSIRAGHLTLIARRTV